MCLRAGEEKDDFTGEKTHGTEQEGGGQKSRQPPAAGACLHHAPRHKGAHEQVEGQVVDPPRQRRPGRGEQQLHIGQRVKAAGRAAEEQQDQQGIKRGEAKRLFLEVAEDNAAALALYKGMGFQEIGRRKKYYHRPDGPAVDALNLALDL